ncbi:MAG TPA: LPS export ABC transporter permease LptF, partial [Sutterella sp.]|nr:LPS export ABC transporter permease LptF [Sutterella sp.]
RTPINNAQILWRLCWPIASAVLALLAIPLSYTNPRQGRSISLVVAVLLFI